MKETYTLKEIEEKLEHEKYLRKENQELYEELQTLKKSSKSTNDLANEEIERLHSIIKEAREYIENEYEENIIIVDYADNPITPQDLYGELLEILDKENK